MENAILILVNVEMNNLKLFNRKDLYIILKRGNRMSGKNRNFLIIHPKAEIHEDAFICLLYTSPSPRD